MNNNLLKNIQNVGKASKGSATLLKIIYVDNKNLLDYPKNKEDISYTEDIEQSIDEVGFADPLEVTDFGMENGKYMIVSGHRRRAAGQKKNIDSFPCIPRKFSSENEIENYALMANSHRDSGKNEPLLLVKRALKHKAYLESVHFKGSIREEVAKRMGIKMAQADRYLYMSTVIQEILDLVQDGILSVSGVTDCGLYRHPPEEQSNILDIVKECIEAGNEMTRPLTKKIVEGFRNGCYTWKEIESSFKVAGKAEVKEPEKSQVQVTKPEEAQTEVTEPEEAQTEVAEPEEAQTEVAEPEEAQTEVAELEEAQTEVAELEEAQTEVAEPEEVQTEVAKDIINGRRIIGRIEDLDYLFTSHYAFDPTAEGSTSPTSALIKMKNLTAMMIQEMREIALEYGLKDKGVKAIEEVLHEAQEVQKEFKVS